MKFSEVLRGHTETIGERLVRDLAALQTPLPPAYDACEKIGTRVSSLSLVRYRSNDYSVPTSFGHREVFVRGYVHEVVIACGTEIIAACQVGWARPGKRVVQALRLKRTFEIVDVAATVGGALQTRRHASHIGRTRCHRSGNGRKGRMAAGLRVAATLTIIGT